VLFKKPIKALKPPVMADEPDATEVLRVWKNTDWQKVQVALMPDDEDPAVWGIALVDIARHVAKAYALQGRMSESACLARIRQLLDAEWKRPTQIPEGRLRD
jgi:hypothetical protein